MYVATANWITKKEIQGNGKNIYMMCMCSRAFITHHCVLPRHLCQPREMFLWIVVPSVCNDKIHVCLYTILSNTVNLLPYHNYKLIERYHLALWLLELWHEHHAIPLIYLCGMKRKKHNNKKIKCEKIEDENVILTHHLNYELLVSK